MVAIQLFQTFSDSSVKKPFIGGIRAGFPSPADDYIQEVLDLTQLVIINQNSTYYGKVVGDSMVNEGINEGDILIIDRAL
jgi:DNA polymerase V